ncbi:MAG: alpha/beta fold hydrolase [bacterium]
MHERIIRKVFAAATFILLLIGFNYAAHCQSLEQARWRFDEFYKYDKDQPFNLKEILLRETDKYKLYRWAFDSVHSKRVTALFLAPKGIKDRAPVILILHGYMGRKEDVISSLDIVSSAGYACLALDAEYHGERSVTGKDLYSKLGYSSRDGIIQTVLDFRRAVDILEMRPEIDPARIGYIGASMGGVFGGVIAAVDQRIRAATLVVGGADWAYLARASVVSDALGLLRGENRIIPKDFGVVIAPADPINWAHNISPRPVLMLNAKYDILVNPLSNKKLFARLNEPKMIVWFAEGHDLSFEPVIKITLEFFNDYLKGDKDPASLGAIVEGYRTKPMRMKLKTPLPEPVTDMPLADFFNYDSFLPLNAKFEKAEDSRWQNHYRAEWQSTHDKTVRGDLYLPAPPEKGPIPTVIYLRALNSDGTEVTDFLDTAVRQGYAVLVMDLPCGERTNPGCRFFSPLVYATRNNILQSIFDVRRAIDFLAARTDAVAASTGFILATSGKINSETAAIAAAVDERIQTLLLLPGKHDDEFLNEVNNIKTTGKYEELQAALDWTSLSIYAPALKGKRIFAVGSASEYLETAGNQINITQSDSLDSVLNTP